MKTSFRQLRGENRINVIELTDAELLRLVEYVMAAPSDLTLSHQVIKAQLLELLGFHPQTT